MTGNHTSFDRLSAREVIQTIERLGERIEAHFPARNLAGVCRELRKLAEICARDARRIARPNWGLRVLTVTGFVGVVAGLVLISIVMFGGDVSRPFGVATSSEMEPFTIADGLDHTFNIVALALVCLIFLSQLEQRAKRRRACKTLHALRSITHVIDMHQLSKRPAKTARGASSAEWSRRCELTPEELARYLDFCTEMLSLTGKVAALYAQNSRDPEIVAATNDIEELAAGLSRKIWQKLMILQRDARDAPRRDGMATSPLLPPENV